ncbi:MAG: hypothetical protein PHS32_06900 [Rhodoferax sp.]|uniref:hypothetical protein n=1 Tax=Rhodoferax sp. TaxID=50421 RepID=UPI00263486E9|nr:hypothetical protein [Rhodoferax sp.]MDD5333457.1 hypothetical protein [Rhodoferax sp.]
MKHPQNTQAAGRLISPTAFVLILVLQFAAVSNAFAKCKICLRGLGCEITAGTCTDKDNVDMMENHKPSSCREAVIAPNPNNYLLYDKAAAKAWFVEGTEKTPIRGQMTPDVLNRWSRETGLRVESANRTKK